MNHLKFTATCCIIILTNLAVFPVASSAQKANNFANKQVGPQPDGSILVPSNQLIRPAGFQVDIHGRPVDLALSPDGKLLFVKNKSSLDLVRLNDKTILQSLPYKHSGASVTGICLSVDGHKVFITNATDRIDIATVTTTEILCIGAIQSFCPNL